MLKRKKKTLALAHDQNKVILNMNIKRREEILSFRFHKRVFFLGFLMHNFSLIRKNLQNIEN